MGKLIHQNQQHVRVQAFDEAISTAIQSVESLKSRSCVTVTNILTKNGARRGAQRSLNPYRVPQIEITLERNEQKQQQQQQQEEEEKHS